MRTIAAFCFCSLLPALRGAEGSPWPALRRTEERTEDA